MSGGLAIAPTLKRLRDVVLNTTTQPKRQVLKWNSDTNTAEFGETGFYLLCEDGGVTPGLGVDFATATANGPLIQDAIDEAKSRNLTLVIDAEVTYAEDVFPKDNSTWIGFGKDVSALTSHPEYLANGPLVNQATADGPLTNWTHRNFRIDGRWSENVEFNIQGTLTSDFTIGDTFYEIDPAEIVNWSAPSGRGLLVLADGNNIGVFTYTGVDLVLNRLTGIVQEDNSNGHPSDFPTGTKFYNGNTVQAGGFRMTEFDNVTGEDIDYVNFGSYCAGIEGRYYSIPAGINAVKKNLNFVRCRFAGSHHADGLDCKQAENISCTTCIGEDNADKDFNVRGQGQRYNGCISKNKRGPGFGLTSVNRTENFMRATVQEDIPVGTGVVVTVTPEGTAPLSQYDDLSHTGWIGPEEVLFDLGPGGSEITLTARGQNGTKETTHTTHSDNLPTYFSVTDDPEGITDSTIDMSDCWCFGVETNVGITLIGGASGKTVCTIKGGGADACLAGLAALGSFNSRLVVQVLGGDFTNNLQTGVMMKSVQWFSLVGLRAHNNGINNVTSGGIGRDNITIAQCSNGGEIVACTADKSLGYGIQLLGDTGYVNVAGGTIDPVSNVLGGLVNNGKIGHNTGSAFNNEGQLRVVNLATTVAKTATYDNGTFGGGATLTSAVGVTLGNIDSVAATVGMRVLVKDQTNEQENGVYTVVRLGSISSSWQLRRSTGFDSWNQFRGVIVHVLAGTVNADTDWKTSGLNTGTIGTTDIIWAAAGSAGSGIPAGGITNADVSATAAIAYSKLNLSTSIVNADVAVAAAIAYSKLNLAASIVNGDIGAAAAIAYSKLNLAGSIVNADIGAAANIALSKLATDPLARANHTGTQAPSTISAGTFSAQIATKTVDLTDAATIAVNAALANQFRVTLTANRTMGNPTGAVDGQWLVFRVKQDAGGSRTLAWDTKFKFGTDLPTPTASTAAAAVDTFLFRYDSAIDKFEYMGGVKGH